MNINITDNVNNEDTNTQSKAAVMLEKNMAAHVEKTIYFKPKEWSISKDVSDSVASRSFITDVFGDMTEAWLLGDWDWKWSQIETTKDLILEKNTDYIFTFWLNGGENDRNNETCQLEIVFDNDNDSKNIYKLNRSYIQYEKHYKGWYLYAIPFNTGDASYTRLRFIAMRAHTAIIPAKDLAEYNDLPLELPQQNVPQRHNIIFGSEGFPHDCWWSANVFGNVDMLNKNQNQQNNGFDKIRESFNQIGDNFGNIGEKIRQQVLYEVDIDEIIENIAADIQCQMDIDNIADEVKNSIDIDSIKQSIINGLKGINN